MKEKVKSKFSKYKIYVLAIIFITVIFIIINSTTATLKEDFSYKSKENERNYYSYVANGFYKYNKNGIIRMSNNFKKELWNHSFFLNNPVMIENDKIVAISENRGHICYVFDKNGLIYEVKTEKPIINFKINKNGYLVLVFETDLGQQISVYDNDGKELIRHISFTEKDGYQLDVDISEDNRILATSYIDIAGNKVYNKISMYYVNAKDGEKYTNNMFYSKGYDFIIPKIKFISEKLVCISENGVIYMSEKGGEIKNNALDLSIFKYALFNNGNYAFLKKDSIIDENRTNEVMYYGSGGNVIKKVKLRNGNINFFQANANNLYVAVDSYYYSIDSSGNILWEKEISKEVTKIYKISSKKYAIVTPVGVSVVEIIKK